MGDPVGIGPEIICMALSRPEVYDMARPLVIGDVRVLERARLITKGKNLIATVNSPGAASYKPGCMDVLNASRIDSDALVWGQPTQLTGRAMEKYILIAADMAMREDVAAVVTCPINKAALKLGGSRFHGHTEMLAHHTATEEYAMMMAGDQLRVVLVTIHMALQQVPGALTIDSIMSTIEITDQSLKERFGIDHPKIAVAGLNPHAGEGGMFGDEEARLIAPAIDFSKKNGIDVSGPWPPDTVFVSAVNGNFDAVVCMYHDQGLIPFKLIHFADGVNTTLGLPIIRTSVDHGTAYDIAGKGIADPGSLIAAIRMAASQAVCRMLHRNRIA
jgi:4-hydroxythreonine-4-phosphate dehydrogenase